MNFLFITWVIPTVVEDHRLLRDVPYRSHDDKIVRIKDPVHNFIDISEYPVIQQLVDTPYFQRLRRLHQLGLAAAVYPSATHSRFTHSIGTMHVFLVLFDSVTKRSALDEDLVAKIRPVGAAAALLHDIGHGPFSHASEEFLDGGKFNHEALSRAIIEKTQIGKILSRNGIKPGLVSAIIKHTVSGKLRFVSQLISSQLDADRIDYLLRDALFTGVPYGRIDVQRVANTLSLWDGQTSRSFGGTIVVLQKGMESIEDYLLGRYHMHKGVYHHKTARCMVKILTGAFKRALEIGEGPYDFTKKTTPRMMLDLDDNACYSTLLEWTRSDDRILSDLSRRLIERQPFKAHRTTAREVDGWREHAMPDIRQALERKGLDPRYYFIEDDYKSSYRPYAASSKADDPTGRIMVALEDGKLVEISQLSPIVRAVSGRDDSILLFYPKKASSKIEEIINHSASNPVSRPSTVRT